ncbi:hypothetical protein Bca4012_020711 [Brassica carinata]
MKYQFLPDSFETPIDPLANNIFWISLMLDSSHSSQFTRLPEKLFKRSHLIPKLILADPINRLLN